MALMQSFDFPRLLDAVTATAGDWRETVDIYFCRFGHEGFPYESGRKNIEFNEADGSFTLFRLQQSDEGLYEIWHDHYRSMCVAKFELRALWECPW